MARKELRQLRRDRRTLALLVFQPLLLLLVFGYAARFDVTEVATAVVGAPAGAVAGQLPPLFDVTEERPAGDRDDAEALLRAGDVTVVVVAGIEPGGVPQLLVDGSQLFAARSVVQAATAAGRGEHVEVLFNPELATPPVLVPALAGIVLVFVGTIATSLGVVRERQAGTMEQLAVMPFRPIDVLAGKTAPYLAVATIDLILVMLVAVTVFDVPFVGSVVVFGVGAALFLILTLGLGLFVSTVSENQGQAIQLAMMVTLPQVLLAGAIFPLESMATWLRWIAYTLPLTWFIEVARGVMLRDAGFVDLWLPLVVLAGLAVAVFGLAVVRVRRDLVPSRPAGDGASTRVAT